jgi:glycosyltransferase involved in cell wall biosynthesis
MAARESTMDERSTDELVEDGWRLLTSQLDRRLGVQDAPHVSVVVTTYHREKWLLEAIASARAQRSVAVEIIVADDSPEGSARRAVESLRDPVIRYLHRAPPSGGRPGLVRNEAVAFARAPLVHFLDDDDRLADGALAALSRALSSTGAGVAFGRIRPFGEPAAAQRESHYFERVAAAARSVRGRRRFAAHLLFLDALFVNSACMVRRDVFQAERGYDLSLRCCEDVELYLRIGRAYGVCFVDRDVLHYRVGAPSIMREVLERPEHPWLLQAHRTMADRYRARYGVVEYRSLQILAKTARRLALV